MSHARPPLAGAGLAAALASLLSASASSEGPLDRVRRAVLPNGLTILLAEDRSLPLVSVGMMYTVGARNEAAGSTGLAHYVEHMCFRATKRFPGHEVTETITRIGGRYTGYTWLDQTFYQSTVSREALERILAIEADRMANAVFDPGEFAQERTSVLAELRSYDDPLSVLYDAVLAASFEIHPYRNNTIGWPSDVEALTRDEAHRFYRRFYHPNNAVLAVVGDLEAEPTMALIRARFGPLPPEGEPTAVRTAEPAQTGQRRITVRRPGPHALALVAFRAPALEEPDFPALVLFDALLAGGKGFRFGQDYPVPAGAPLPRALVGSGLATEARTRWQASRYPYVYVLSAATPTAPELPRAEEALFRTLAEAAERSWSEAERGAALRQIRGGWARDLDTRAGRAHQLAFFEVAGGHQHLLDLPDRVATVTPDELRRFARERLRPHQATVGWFEPTDPPAVPQRPAPPPPPPVPVVTKPMGTSTPASPSPVPPPVSFVLESGLQVMVHPLTRPALVALHGRIDAGSVYDGEAPGLSALATELLAAPAADDEAQPLALTLTDDPTAFANLRWIDFSATCLPEELPALLRSVAERLSRAAPAGDAWERLRRAAGLRARTLEATADTALWSRGLRELLPRGGPRAPWATEEQIGRLRADDLQSFLQEHVRPSRTRLALAGAVEPGAVRQALSALMAPRERPASREPARVVPRGPAQWTEMALPHPGKAQNELMVLWPGDRSRPWDRAATAALLYLLGETGYAGRLGRALVDPGLVYWVQATLQEADGVPGFLMIRTAAAADDTRETLRRIRSVLEEAARGGFTRAELDEARTYLAGKALREREGASAAASGAFRDVPSVEELSLEQLNDTARRLFRRGAPLALVGGPGY